MAELAIAATIAGAAVTAAGTLAAGADAKEASYFKAAQENQGAMEARAAAQRQMFERRRGAELLTKKIQAGAAGSGSDATSPDIVKLSSDVIGRGEYQALSEMYGGENRARGLEDAAVASRMTGDAEKRGSYYKAAGTLLSAGGSVYNTYKGRYG